MIRKIIAACTALLIIAMFLPLSYGKDSSGVGVGLRDRERYYHRLHNMRRNDPENPEISYQIANLYYSLQMEDEAIMEYRKTLELDPEHSYARYFLSKLLVNKGYYEDAFWIARELISRHRNSARLYAFIGEILVKMDQRFAAKEYFDKYDELISADRHSTFPVESATDPARGNWKKYFY